MNINKIKSLTSLQLTAKQLCDFELLANGGFWPLTGFLNQQDFNSVLSRMRLASGEVWPIPIMLDVKSNFAEKLSQGQSICLRDSQYNPLAILSIADIWQADKQAEAQAVFGASDLSHPGLNELINNTKAVYLGRELEIIA